MAQAQSQFQHRLKLASLFCEVAAYFVWLALEVVRDWNMLSSSVIKSAGTLTTDVDLEKTPEC